MTGNVIVLGLTIKLIILVFVANGAPVLASRIYGNRFATPVDLRACWFDGRRYLGDTKTYRGIIAAFLLTPLAAWLIGLSPQSGVAIAAGAMAGDLLSSMLKRRLGIPSSGRAFGLDQIPEAVIPLLAVKSHFNLELWQIGIAVLVFLILGHIISRLLYHLSIRSHPY